MKKLCNFRLSLLTVFSLAFGIAEAYFITVRNLVAVILLGVIYVCAILLYVLFCRANDTLKTSIKYLIIALFFCVAGALSFTFSVEKFSSADVECIQTKFSGYVKEKYSTDYGEKLVIEKVKIHGEKRLKYNVGVVVYGDTKADIGDRISFTAVINNYTAFYDGKFSATGIERGIKYYASVEAKDLSITGRDRDVFQNAALFIRDTLSESMEGDEFAVSYALLTGNSEFMDEDVITRFRSAGVAHIFAVSGLHIGFLATALTFLFRKLKFNKYLSAVFTIITLFFYSGVCGFSASSVRAAVMCTVVILSTIVGIKYDGLSSWSLAGTVILFFSPIQLFCVGFQLSFTIVFFILAFSSTMNNAFKKLPSKLSSALSVTLIAQLASIPISLYAFDKFSTVSVLVNLLFIPVVGVVYILLFVMTLLGGILTVPTVTLFIPKYIIKALTFIITLTDYKIFLIGGFVFGIFAIFYYATMISLSGLLNIKKVAKTVTVVTLALICVAGTLVYNGTVNVFNKDACYVYVSGSENISASMLVKGDENVLIVSNVSYVYSPYRLQRLSNTVGTNKLDNVIVENLDGLDLQVFLTKLSYVFDVANLSYYGYRQDKMESIIRKSFPDINIKCYEDGVSIPSDNFGLEYAIEGHCVIADAGKKSALFFSKFGYDSAEYLGVHGDYDLIVCYDYVDNIFNSYTSKDKISYLPYSLYKDAQTYGNIKYRLN